jgi:hypothetical protein
MMTGRFNLASDLRKLVQFVHSKKQTIVPAFIKFKTPKTKGRDVTQQLFSAVAPHGDRACKYPADHYVH